MTAINPLRVAIATALEALNKRVYHEGEVSRGAALPYTVIGTASEDEGGFQHQPGQDWSVQLKFWAEDSWAAQEEYEDAKTALHGVSLPMTGHTLIVARMRRITDFAEPDPEIGGHVVIGELNGQSLAA